MPLPPFTHHEILALAEPFARHGWQADLAASDRVERRLAFIPRRPVAAQSDPARATDPAAPVAGLAPSPGPPAHAQLHLVHTEPGHFRLTRVLALAGGLQASLRAEGADAAELLAGIEAVPASRQFQHVDGATVALHQRLAPARTAGAVPVLVLQRAEACVAGLRLEMVVSGVSGFPAELELLRGDSAVRELPEDLLAVLGRPWHRLTTIGRGWLGAVHLRGAEPQRSRDAEARLRRTVAHLVRTLCEPPARFHERFRGARWTVACRGMLPLLVGLAIVAAAFLMKREGSAQAMSGLGLLANIAPPLLMCLFFLRRDMPRIGLPRLPRRPAPGAWPSTAP